MKQKNLYDLPKSDMTLRDKVTLVISPDSENSRSLIHSLASRGSDIVFVCLPTLTQMGLQLQAEVESLGRRCLVVVGEDLTSWEFSEQLIQQIGHVYGRLDAFVDFSAQIDEVEWEEEMNLPNVMMMTAILKQMVA